MKGSTMRVNTVFAAVLLSACAVQVSAFSQDDQNAEATKKWMEYMTPGDHHKLLKFKEGRWDLTVRMWPSPDAPASESPAESEATLILGDRFLLDKVKGSFGGMPFEGMGTTGYDNHRKKFVFTWIDNMGTGVMVGEGDYDPQTKTWTYQVNSTDPITGKPAVSRGTERIVDGNTWVMQSFNTGPSGKEFKAMEITYKRKK
jgi:hypothetical protein